MSPNARESPRGDSNSFAVDHQTIGPREPARPPTLLQPPPHAAGAETRVRPVRPIRFTPSRTEPIPPPSHAERASAEREPQLIARVAAWIAIAIGWTIFVSWWAIVLRQETARSLGIAFGLLTAALAVCVVAMLAWTSYNIRLARKATRRQSNRPVVIRWERDTLGRRLELPAGDVAWTAPEVRVVLKDGVKAYIAVDPEEL